MSEALPLQLKLYSSLRDIPEAAWNQLVLQDLQALPFMEWRWLEAFESSGCVSPETGWQPSHLTLWRGNHLVAAAPAYLKYDSHGEFVFDWSWASAAERLGIAYYPKLLLAAPLAPATGTRMLVAAGEDRAAREAELIRGALQLARSEGLSSVHVLFCTEQESAHLEAQGFCVRHGVQYHWKNHDYATYDDFLARFNSKRRNQLRRESKAVADGGVTLHTIEGEALATVDPKLVYALYASTVDRHVWGRRHLNFEFFQTVMRDFRHRIQLVLAKKADRVVAGAFNLLGPQTLYGRYWGSLEEVPFLHFKVCLYHPVEEAIARKLARFEPGAGGEHKLVRGFEPSLTYSAHWISDATLDRAVRDFLTHERAAIAQGLPAWNAETGFKT